jgi:nuclear pore complex protein Nup155
MYSQPGGPSFAFTPGHGIQPQHMSTPNPNYGDHYMYGQHQMMQTPYTMVSSNAPGPAPITDVTFSGKHNGICIYFSRIIRPLWDNKIVSDVPYQTPAGTSQFVSLLFGTMHVSLQFIICRGVARILKGGSFSQIPDFHGQFQRFFL